MKFSNVVAPIITALALISTTPTMAMNTPGAGPAENGAALCNLSAEQLNQKISTDAALNEFRDHGTIDGVAADTITLMPKTAQSLKKLNANLVYRFDHADLQPQVLSGHTSSVTSLAFSQDDTTLATSSSYPDAVFLWNQPTPGTWKQITSHEHLRTVPASTPTDDSVREWNSHNSVKVTASALSDDGSLLALALKDHTVHLWRKNKNNDTWEHITTFYGYTDKIASLAFSHDGKTLATGSYDTTVNVYALVNDAWQAQAMLKGHASLVFSVALSPDGNTLASASYDRTVRLWHHVDNLWKLETIFTGHHDAVNAVLFNHQGSALASASSDKTAHVWHALDLVGNEQVVAKIMTLRVIEHYGIAPQNTHFETTWNSFDAQAKAYLQNYIQQECPICMATIKEVRDAHEILVKLSCCKKQLCHPCFLKLLAQKNECPLCRHVPLSAS